MVTNSSPLAPSARCFRPRTRRGFSFPEILFAVMILGVGMIMVASMLPIGIKMSQETVNAQTSLAIAQNAKSFLPALILSDGSLTPGDLAAPEHTVASEERWKPITSSLKNLINGNQINLNDPRFAWVPLMYRRELLSDEVHFISIIAQVTGRDRYDTESFIDLTNSFPRPVANLQPRRIGIRIPAESSPGVFVENTVVLTEIGAGVDAMPGALGAAAEGAYVVVYNDNITTPTSSTGRMNGKYYQLGIRRTDLDLTNAGDSVYELLITGPQFEADVGSDSVPNTADDINTLGQDGTAPSTVVASGPAYAYVIGRSFSDVSVTPTTSDEYESAKVQDVRISTFSVLLTP